MTRDLTAAFSQCERSMTVVASAASSLSDGQLQAVRASFTSTVNIAFEVGATLGFGEGEGDGLVGLPEGADVEGAAEGAGVGGRLGAGVGGRLGYSRAAPVTTAPSSTLPQPHLASSSWSRDPSAAAAASAVDTPVCISPAVEKPSAESDA